MLDKARDIVKSILIVFGVSPTDGMKNCKTGVGDERTIVEVNEPNYVMLLLEYQLKF